MPFSSENKVISKHYGLVKGYSKKVAYRVSKLWLGTWWFEVSRKLTKLDQLTVKVVVVVQEVLGQTTTLNM